MSPSVQKADAYDWEKKDAPKITRGQMAVAFAAYLAWTIFLTVLAVGRWSSLQ
jgi:hypothetical protein